MGDSIGVMRLKVPFIASVLFLALFAVPFFSQAAETTASNLQCTPWDIKCPCGGGIGPKCRTGKGNTANCPPGICKETVPNGKVDGICELAGKCKGVNFSTQSGGMQGVQGLMQMLQQLMQMKQQQDQQKAQQEALQQQAQQGCTQYYQVTSPSSDPCAYYVPPTSDSLLDGQTGDTSGALLDALGSGGNVSDQLTGALNVPVSPAAASTSTGGLAGQAVNLQGGTQGDIQVGPSRATVFATAKDPNANTVVAGFYGSNTLGGEQPQSLAARMCQNRPWSGSIVSYIIPPAFFDSLCTFRGYKVGSPPPPPPAPPAVAPASPAATTTPPAPPPAASLIPPEVDIWANPAQIPLGSRTTIFWSSKGVDSCAVTSSDGSFDEKTLSGGAATVPLSGATTFTLSCKTPDAKTVIDSVTVNMAI